MKSSWRLLIWLEPPPDRPLAAIDMAFLCNVKVELWMTFRNNYNVSSAIRSSRKLLTNDEPKPRSRSKFAGSEKPKVGHKRIWPTKSVAASRQYQPSNKPAYKRHSLPLLRRIAAVLDADVVVALIPRKAA